MAELTTRTGTDEIDMTIWADPGERFAPDAFVGTVGTYTQLVDGDQQVPVRIVDVTVDPGGAWAKFRLGRIY